MRSLPAKTSIRGAQSVLVHHIISKYDYLYWACFGINDFERNA
ncbi:hypothetical protein AGR4C_pa50037 [Agrobacterium tumefaciens str. Kerr 14]|uniref:Uncharacterized protein n=1 Tax=Agrobacterium tumefaciens str. Kerr 14 TaxID=1183424 RepID=A0A1S7SC00_AGRTU|nr:hypothetical protein AGR4C_pa50037 [Agrobacterium tumefaciens str. Kerr 14]